jgi:hypothetical protein
VAEAATVGGCVGGLRRRQANLRFGRASNPIPSPRFPIYTSLGLMAVGCGVPDTSEERGELSHVAAAAPSAPEKLAAFRHAGGCGIDFGGSKQSGSH